MITEVYGQYEDGIEEERLASRYQDWVISTYATQRRPHGQRQAVLPNPHNMGEAWYAQAITAIEEDITQFEHTADWKEYWSRCGVFNNNLSHFDRIAADYLIDAFGS